MSSSYKPFDIFKDLVDTPTDTDFAKREHMATYISEARLPLDWNRFTEAALQYWQQQEPCRPELAIMARDVLAVPATSVDVERLFSQARNVVTHQRHRLDKQTISDIGFYRSSIARKRKEQEDKIDDGYKRWRESQWKDLH